ncbi:rhomboid family intramembrane serine protease [Campylobacter coli]|nr:rhomboid family intramembrane serine protease [Campylobacter coli]
MVVILLILLNILFYFTIPYGYYNLLGLNILFFKGAYWQILSSMFMHGNLTHLILNMIVLFQFGRILESYLGALRFFLLYIIGGLMCSLLSAFYYFGGMINLVGASGAICVLMGYYAFLDKSSTKGLIVAILLMSFAPLLMGVNVAWYGHIFGFICGYFLGKLRRKI